MANHKEPPQRAGAASCTDLSRDIGRLLRYILFVITIIRKTSLREINSMNFIELFVKQKGRFILYIFILIGKQ